MSRPRSLNPKTEQIGVRFTPEEHLDVEAVIYRATGEFAPVGSFVREKVLEEVSSFISSYPGGRTALRGAYFQHLEAEAEARLAEIRSQIDK